MLRLGFSEDSGIAEVKKLLTRLNDLRYPLAITVGIKNQSQFYVNPIRTVTSCNWDIDQKNKGKRAFSTNDLDSYNKLPAAPTQLKLVSDLSRSPYCEEYDRVGLGSVNFISKNKGQWRHSTINTPFTVCPR